MGLLNFVLLVSFLQLGSFLMVIAAEDHKAHYHHSKDSTKSELLKIVERLRSESLYNDNVQGASSGVRAVEPCGLSNPPSSSRIVGGVEAVPNEFPWQAFVTSRFTYPEDGAYVQNICSGSLIGPEWVITSAECIKFLPASLGGINDVTVVLGMHDWSLPASEEPNRVSFTTNETFIYPSWNLTDFYVDNVALVKLPRAVNVSDYIRPICLPDSADPDHDGDPIVLAGWGQSDLINGGSYTYQLMKTSTTVLPLSRCQSFYDITSDIICSDGFQFNGPCLNDQGGPMMHQPSSDAPWTLLGVNSFLDSYCDQGLPSGYARMRSYLDWINSVTGGIVV